MTAAAPTGASAPEGAETGSERSRTEAGTSGGRAEPAERLTELGARTAPPVTVFSAPAPAGSAFGLRAFFEWISCTHDLRPFMNDFYRVVSMPQRYIGSSRSARPNLKIFYSVRSAVAVRAFAAHPAGSIAPHTATATPPTPSRTSSSSP